MTLQYYAKRRIKPGWPTVYKEQKKAIKRIEKHIGLEDYFPPPRDVFNAFKYTSLDELKVVIIGQDPYHKEGQAMGLSFSVNKGVDVPPSLKNIYKELKRSIDGFKTPNHGNLTRWAKQGVLMLNMALTVKPGAPKSHMDKWDGFLNGIIDEISKNKRDTIFVLWGGQAIKIKDRKKFKVKYVLTAGHPSPLNTNPKSAFIGCNHFVIINEILENLGEDPIDWRL